MYPEYANIFSEFEVYHPFKFVLLTHHWGGAKGWGGRTLSRNVPLKTYALFYTAILKVVLFVGSF